MSEQRAMRALVTRGRKGLAWHSHRALRRALHSIGSDWARQSLFVDFPVHPASRWGHGLPPHPELEALFTAERQRYEAHLDAARELVDALRRIPISSDDPHEPYWANIWYTGLDATSLYSMITHADPAVYLEVGSGTSTKFVRRAIRDHGLRTRIVSIDPEPRAAIDEICDEVVRSPLEDADLSVFEKLQAGDVLFLDGSHRVFPNSDVTVAFLEVIPRLAPGVLVHVHDVFLPFDYPREWTARLYSEQYVLAAWLLGGGGGSHIEFSSAWVSSQPDLHGRLDPLWDHLRGADVPTNGWAFWMRADAAPPASG